MNTLSRLLILFVAFLTVSGCQYLLGEKQSEDVSVQSADGEIIFIIPRMPRFDALYVEKYNIDSKRHNKWEGVWTIDLSALPRNVRIEYGKAPIGVAPDRMSAAEPLKTGVLYSVGMDVGSTVVHGYFELEDSALGIRVNNLTYEEAKKYFVTE